MLAVKKTQSLIIRTCIWGADRIAFLLSMIYYGIRKNHPSIKVIHVANFAHKPFILTRRLRENGIEAEYLALNVDWTYLHMGEKAYDYAIESTDQGIIKYYMKQFYMLWFILAKCDIIHVHSQSIMSHNMKEYRFLKRLNKKLIFHFRGCDIRRKSDANGFFPDLNCCQECDYPIGACDNEQQKIYIKTVKELGDAFFCTTPDLLPFSPTGTKYLPFTSPPEDFMSEIKPVLRDKGIFRVVTSSNHDGVDGTQYIRDAVKKLKEEGRKIELVEVKKTPYKEALSIYASADVYAGKLRMGFYNNANIECMMLGVPCMSFIRPEFREKYCPDCPVIQATPNTIYEVLKEYTSKPEELRRIGKLGPDFIRKYHSEEKSIKPLIECYQMLTNRANM